MTTCEGRVYVPVEFQTGAHPGRACGRDERSGIRKNKINLNVKSERGGSRSFSHTLIDGAPRSEHRRIERDHPNSQRFKRSPVATPPMPGFLLH